VSEHARRARAAGPRTITPALLRAWPLPEVDGALGKVERGQVLVVGGSEQVPGAVILSAVAALRAGAGTLQIATSRSVAPYVATQVPEARVIGLSQTRSGELAKSSCRAIHEEVERADAVLIGPGMFDGRAGMELVQHCLSGGTRAALIVDAAALTALRSKPRTRRKSALTVIAMPHAGEMAKLWGVTREQVMNDPLALARSAAQELDIVLALKGAETFIGAPDGRVFRNTAGNPGLGTSGSGDTLAGITAGLCARGADPLQATVWGVYLHAKAGEALARSVAPLGFLARELPGEVPRLLAQLKPRRSRTRRNT
jgi:hydroxyethylthiazole kinase-like uncharacterized protein yjeF